MVTGDSQEEVMIFRDKQTELHHNIYIIIIITIMQGEQANINIIVAWAEGALVQVRLHLFNLITDHFTTT